MGSVWRETYDSLSAYLIHVARLRKDDVTLWLASVTAVGGWMRIVCALLYLGLVGALQREQVAQHAIKLHRGRGAATKNAWSWVSDNCRRLGSLLRQKNTAIRKLSVAATAVGRDHSLSDPERLFQVHTLEVFQKELNESERSVFQAVLGLQRALQGDYRDVVNMKESSHQRLEALREAAIKSMVQVETLGELGVFFTLFLVGLEFSPERLRKVWKTSVLGSCYLSLLMVAAGLVWGQMLHIRPTQTVFISSCLSLSSTPLVSRFLAGGSRGEKDGELDYSSVLLGMLVMQDVQLGLFIAVMPTLIQASSGDLDSVLFGSLRVFLLLARVLFSLAVVLLLCGLLKSYLIGPYYRKLHTESKGNKEILVLGTAAFVFLMLTVTEFLDISMELGCFLAGALLSSQGHICTTEVMGCIEPIRDFLAIIFFASIGFHVFPTFVLYELTILAALTLSLVLMKFLMAVLVLSAILPPGSRHIRWIVSAGLAQVSEFSFVLGSRARRAGIISREVYLLVLSVTTLSLLLAPVLWRAATHKWVPRTERKALARPPPLLPYPAD
ncbi:hypothetical protein DPEC_G00148050 [Dallia pectoralis]|uniref:Uncharacterized protein n=1 Tax=Dallia pectoralis TaxID=75939 RepID=A0ACC2GIL7_DALPE|nr:hypothetical protein DPEC_G00148050 [Dallia pectoralis]